MKKKKVPMMKTSLAVLKLSVIACTLCLGSKAAAQAGNVGINTITPTATLHVKGNGNTSATQALKLENSDGTNLLTVNDDGSVSGSAVANFGGSGGTGVNGKNALVKTTAEPAGANCANGGIKVESGVDLNGDNTLGTNEISDTKYVCNGSNGATGATGATGPMGPQGPAGPAGTNGQGVPTGGTTGQVLAKVNGTDYNTAWVTPSAGGSAYPNVELYISNTTIQNIPDLLGGAGSTLLTFSATNNPNASLTGGNTWNGSVFTVGTAGWYEIDVQIVGVTNTGGLSSNGVDFFMDKNNTVGASKTGALYRNVRSTQPSETILKNTSTLHTIIYLNAGDNIRFRGFAWSNSLAANTSADGSTYLTIVRVK